MGWGTASPSPHSLRGHCQGTGISIQGESISRFYKTYYVMFEGDCGNVQNLLCDD